MFTKRFAIGIITVQEVVGIVFNDSWRRQGFSCWRCFKDLGNIFPTRRLSSEEFSSSEIDCALQLVRFDWDGAAVGETVCFSYYHCESLLRHF